jgi:hypothetical protein
VSGVVPGSSVGVVEQVIGLDDVADGGVVGDCW